MHIIIGHTNIDLDCLGSIALAKVLYPDAVCLRSRLIHPVARNLYNLYQNVLDLHSINELPLEQIKKITILDTRNYSRVREYLDLLKNFAGEIEIWDHHIKEETDISGSRLIEGSTGSNTSLLGLRLMEMEERLSRDIATIALTGVYADTGNFTHDNVSENDFQVSAYLLEEGAVLSLVKTFMKPLREKHQITLFHSLLNSLSYREYNGHPVILSYMELEKQTGGLSAVVEKVFEVEDTDAIFSVFHFQKEGHTLIVGRSQSGSIDIPAILDNFGGGGHQQAASALVKKSIGSEIFRSLDDTLKMSLTRAVTAGKIMSRDVHTISPNWSLLKASIFLESIDHTGAPVVNEKNEVVGFMTLRDIMKGRKTGKMKSPVSAYMSRKIICAEEATTIREIQELLFINNIGHLPVVKEKKLVGILTRSDFIQNVHSRSSPQLL